MKYSVNDNAAYVIREIKRIQGRCPGKKLFQKIMFLIEEKGIDLNFSFGLHFYGPYSEELNKHTVFLSSEGIIQFNYSGYSHRMEVNEEVFEVSSNELTEKQKEVIKELLLRYKSKSASELELLTTAIYVYNHLDDKTKDAIIAGVKKIKGEKYSTVQIKSMFREFDFFNKTLYSNSH